MRSRDKSALWRPRHIHTGHGLENCQRVQSEATAAVELTVGSCWVQHVLGQEDTWDLNNVVDGTTESSGQRTQSNGRGLSDNDPRSWRRTQGEENRDDQSKRSLSQVGCCADTDGACDTKRDQEDKVGERTPQVDVTSAVVCGQNPGQHDEDHLECRSDQSQGEGEFLADTSLCLAVITCSRNQKMAHATYG